MEKIKKLLRKWTEMSLVLRILTGLTIGTILGLVIPEWTTAEYYEQFKHL